MTTGYRAGAWGRALGGAILIAIGAFAAPAAWADDYCCVCKGKKKGKDIRAGDDFTAGAQCSLECRRPTRPKPGKCEDVLKPEAPVAAPTPAPTPATAAAPATGTVLLFASDDCSGDATKVSGTTSDLAEGLRSFTVESGGPASVWEEGDFSGRRTQPVGPTLCVSPGWEIGSVRIGR
jgi:hypothetical protein